VNEGLSIGEVDAVTGREYLNISCPNSWSSNMLDLFLIIFVQLFVSVNDSVTSIGTGSMMLNGDGYRLFKYCRR